MRHTQLTSVFTLIIIVGQTNRMLIIRSIFRTRHRVRIQRLQPRIVHHTTTRRRMAQSLTNTTVNAFTQNVNIINRLITLVTTISIRFPHTFNMASTGHTFIFQQRQRAITFIQAIFTSTHISVNMDNMSVGANRHQTRIIRHVISTTFSALVTHFATDSCQVINLITFMLIIRISRRHTSFHTRHTIIVTHTRFPNTNLFQFCFTTTRTVKRLTMLRTTRQAFNINMRIPIINSIVGRIRHQRHNIMIALMLRTNRIIILLQFSRLMTGPQHSNPLTSISPIVSRGHVNLDTTANITIITTINNQVNIINGQLTVARFVTNLISMTVTSTSFVTNQTRIRALNRANFRAARPVLTQQRQRRHTLVRVATTRNFNRGNVNNRFTTVLLVTVTRVRRHTTTPRLVFQTHKLMQVNVMVNSVRTTKRINLTFMVLHRHIRTINIIRLMFTLRGRIISLHVTIFTPITTTNTKVRGHTTRAIINNTTNRRITNNFRTIITQQEDNFDLGAALSHQLVKGHPDSRISRTTSILQTVARNTTTARRIRHIRITRTRQHRQWLQLTMEHRQC